MSNRFVISDTHFGHTNTWAKFTHRDGGPLRPFTSTEEMDDHMVECWNSVVGPKDIVYHLGDVAMTKRGLQTVRRLNGRKKLILGNHDEHVKNQDLYDVGFESLHAVKEIKGMFVMTHVPMLFDSLERWSRNVHGHMHDSFVRHDKWPGKRHPNYLCVSVEQVDYTPISFEEVMERFDNASY